MIVLSPTTTSISILFFVFVADVFRGARDGAEDGDDRAWEGDDGRGLKMHARLEPLGMFFSRFSYLTNVYLSIDYTYDDHHHT